MAGNLICYPHTNARNLIHDGTLPYSHNAIDAIQSVEGPVVEVGGPTDTGFRQFGNKAVLSSLPIVGNLTDNTGNPDIFFDAKKLPFSNGSIGLFLARCIADADFMGCPSFNTHEKQAKLSALATQEYDAALTDPNYIPKYNLRIAILREMSRALKPGGIVVFEGLNRHDIEFCEAIGWLILNQDPTGTRTPPEQHNINAVFQAPNSAQN